MWSWLYASKNNVQDTYFGSIPFLHYWFVFWLALLEPGVYLFMDVIDMILVCWLYMYIFMLNTFLLVFCAGFTQTSLGGTWASISWWSGIIQGDTCGFCCCKLYLAHLNFIMWDKFLSQFHSFVSFTCNYNLCCCCLCQTYLKKLFHFHLALDQVRVSLVNIIVLCHVSLCYFSKCFMIWKMVFVRRVFWK